MFRKTLAIVALSSFVMLQAAYFTPFYSGTVKKVLIKDDKLVIIIKSDKKDKKLVLDPIPDLNPQYIFSINSK